MAKTKITALVPELLGDFLKERGLELYNVEYVKEGPDRFLRVYLDKISEDGTDAYVDINECETVSRYLSDRLDEADPIEQNYYLEVSSPGLDRTLFREKDYRRFAGREVEVSLYTAFLGKKKYEGVLGGLEGDMLILDVPGTKKNEAPSRLEIPFAQVAKTKLKVVF